MVYLNSFFIRRWFVFITEKPRRPRGFFYAVNFLRKLQVMSTGIYIIESPTNKIYVGQSVDLKIREQKYAKLNCDGQMRIYRSIQKYGWDAHKFSVIMPLKDGTDKTILNWYEQFFMDYYRSEGIELLNLKDAGAHGRFSEESKQKMSKSHTGKILSEEHKSNLKLARGKRIFSPETRLKMSQWQKGRKATDAEIERLKFYAQNHSPETRQKMSVSRTGKKASNETKQKMRQSRLGRKHSDKAKANMSIAQQNNQKIRKLTKDQISLMLVHFQNGLNDTEIGKIFNIGRKAINDIRIGKRWAYITGIKRKPSAPINRTNPEDIPLIVQKITAGEAYKLIANDFGVSYGIIYGIKSGRLWSSISGIKQK